MLYQVVPWLYHHWHSVPRPGDKQENRQSFNHTCKAHQESMGEQTPYNTNKDSCIQGLCGQHPSLRQRVLAHILSSREKAASISHALPPEDPRDNLARQGHKWHCTHDSGYSNHVHAIAATSPSLARACIQNGGWKNTKGPAVRRACLREKEQRQTPSQIQWRMQAWHESLWHRCKHVGRSCSR